MPTIHETFNGVGIVPISFAFWAKGDRVNPDKGFKIP